MISGSPSAICAGGWLPRRLPGKRLRDLFPNNSGGKFCNKLLCSRSRFYFIWDQSRIIYEDPEPNYYFCINNNNFVIIFIFRIRSRIFRIRSRIFRIRRCIIILLIIISLFFLRIRSRIIILLIIRIILLILKGPEWKKHKDYELIIIY